MHQFLENIAHYLLINQYIFIIYMVSMTKAHILECKKYYSGSADKLSSLRQFSLKQCLPVSELKICVFTDLSLQVQIYPLQGRQSYLFKVHNVCFGDASCCSALVINIYAFSKWNSHANKHWCFVLFFNISRTV